MTLILGGMTNPPAIVQALALAVLGSPTIVALGLTTNAQCWYPFVDLTTASFPLALLQAGIVKGTRPAAGASCRGGMVEFAIFFPANTDVGTIETAAEGIVDDLVGWTAPSNLSIIEVEAHRAGLASVSQMAAAVPGQDFMEGAQQPHLVVAVQWEG